MNDVREQLAAYAHDAWSGWMRHLFKKSRLRGDGSVVIPAAYVVNLLKLMDAPYQDMAESSKDSDRKEADRMLAIVQPDRATLSLPENHAILTDEPVPYEVGE